MQSTVVDNINVQRQQKINVYGTKPERHQLTMLKVSIHTMLDAVLVVVFKT